MDFKVYMTIKFNIVIPKGHYRMTFERAYSYFHTAFVFLHYMLPNYRILVYMTFKGHF